MSPPFRLATRIAAVQPSPTLAVSARARELRRRGVDVLSFAAGEPDLETPRPIVEAAAAALAAGKTRYTPAAGLPELREAVARRLAADLELDVEGEQIVVTCGAKFALYGLFQVLLDPGDEVLIPAPFWVSFPEMVRLAEGVPRFVACDPAEGFAPTPAALDRMTTDRTRLLVLNSPSNPTGAVYDAAVLEEIAAWLRRRPQIGVITDETYYPLVYGDARHRSIAALAPDLADRIVVVASLSKAYAMTGWRVGYAAAPRAVARALATLCSHATSNVNTPAQYGAIEALRGDQRCVTDMVATFARRRDRMCAGLASLPGVDLVPPQGAFYVFPRVGEVLAWPGARSRGLGSTLDLATLLLDEARVATVPGEAFGAPGHLRLSFATAEAVIDEGLERLGRLLEALRRGGP